MKDIWKIQSSVQWKDLGSLWPQVNKHYLSARSRGSQSWMRKCQFKEPTCRISVTEFTCFPMRLIPFLFWNFACFHLFSSTKQLFFFFPVMARSSRFHIKLSSHPPKSRKSCDACEAPFNKFPFPTRQILVMRVSPADASCASANAGVRQHHMDKPYTELQWNPKMS